MMKFIALLKAPWHIRIAGALLLLLIPTLALADATAATFPGTAANDAAVGTVAWTDPGNITADDTLFATVTGNNQSNYLKATNFGFAISAGATIDGITVGVRNKAASPGEPGEPVGTDTSVKIVGPTGTIGGVSNTEKDGANTPLDDTESTFTYGGATDKWGETLSVDDVNDVDFGVVWSGSRASASATHQIDYIQMTVNYTPGAVPELSDVGLFFLVFACLYIAYREGFFSGFSLMRP